MLLLSTLAQADQRTVPSDETLDVAIATIASNSAGAIIITERQQPVGILTERDIVRLIDAGTATDTRLDAFRKPTVCAHGERTLVFAANLMLDRNIRRLVVVDDRGRCVGLVTQDDIVKHLEEEIYQTYARVFHILYNRRQLLTLPPDAPLRDAVSLMATHDVGSIVVIADRRAAGIVTERDVVRMASLGTDGATRLGDVMSAPVVTCSIDASVKDLLQTMQEKRIRRVVVLDGEGHPLGIITNRDLLRNVEGSYSEFLRHKLQHAREILDALPEIVIEVVDVGGESVIQWCNRKTVEELGGNPVDRPVTSLIAPDAWLPIHATLVEAGKIEKRLLDIRGRVYEISGSCMKLYKENVIQCILRDVTEALKRSATDFLTNIPNRRNVEELLEAELQRVDRYGRPLSLLLFDVDGFKGVNDTHGHPQGDRVLQEIARIVSEVVRRSDTVGRWGGDEFLVVCPESQVDEAMMLAERIRRAVEAHRFEGVGAVTISVGVAGCDAGDTPEGLKARVDDALYLAKRAGRNRVGSAESR